MKNIIKLIICFLVLTNVYGESLSKQEFDFVKSTIPNTSVKNIEKAPFYGFYKVLLKNDRVFYVNPFQKLIFIGNIYTSNGVNLTEEDKNSLTENIKKSEINIDVNRLKENAIYTKKGNGSNRYEVIVFTDPECPICKRFDETLKSFENIDIYFNFFPLRNLHPNAEKYSLILLEKNEYFNTLENIKDLQNINISDDNKKRLELMEKEAKKIGVTGTPTVIIYDKKEKKIVEKFAGANKVGNKLRFILLEKYLKLDGDLKK